VVVVLVHDADRDSATPSDLALKDPDELLHAILVAVA
jgi:hypothetical protein